MLTPSRSGRNKNGTGMRQQILCRVTGWISGHGNLYDVRHIRPEHVCRMYPPYRIHHRCLRPRRPDTPHNLHWRVCRMCLPCHRHRHCLRLRRPGTLHSPHNDLPAHRQASYTQHTARSRRVCLRSRVQCLGRTLPTPPRLPIRLLPPTIHACSCSISFQSSSHSVSPGPPPADV